MPNLTYTSYELLALLSRRSLHGYDLGETHGNYFGLSRQIPYGQVYATLKRLQRDGFAQAESVSRSGGPDRTHYGITEDGMAALIEWLAEVNAAISVDEIERKVLTLLLTLKSEDAVRILDDYIASLEDYLATEAPSPESGLTATRQKIDATLRRSLIDWMFEVRESRPLP